MGGICNIEAGMVGLAGCAAAESQERERDVRLR